MTSDTSDILFLVYPNFSQIFTRYILYLFLVCSNCSEKLIILKVSKTNQTSSNINNILLLFK